MSDERKLTSHRKTQTASAGGFIDENGNIYMPDGTPVLDGNGENMTIYNLYAEIGAKVQVDLSDGEEEFFEPEGGSIDFYNPYTGEILPGVLEMDDPAQAITDIVNETLGIHATWETIAMISFFDEDGRSIDPKDLVGRKTKCSLDQTCPFDVQDLFFEECRDAIEDLDKVLIQTSNKFKDSLDDNFKDKGLEGTMFYNVSKFLYLFRRKGPYDYINSFHPIFGAKVK